MERTLASLFGPASEAGIAVLRYTARRRERFGRIAAGHLRRHIS
jgi:hypothetical protein